MKRCAGWFVVACLLLLWAASWHHADEIQPASREGVSESSKLPEAPGEAGGAMANSALHSESLAKVLPGPSGSYKILDYRVSPGRQSGFYTHEWLLDSGRADTPIRIIEKRGPGKDGEEQSLGVIEMAANRILVGMPAQARNVLESSLSDHQIIPVASGLFAIRAATYDLDTVDQMLADARSLDAVNYAEPDYIVRPSVIPNDPRIPEQWFYRNNGQTGGTGDADIDADEGWDFRHDAGNVVIAIIDTGIRPTHEDLEANIWRNGAESPDGIDNDGNGIVDDILGYNAVLENGFVQDDDGHGTHVAGIAGAVGNNGVGVTGAAWNVQLMTIKFIDSGFGSTLDAVQSIDYAISKGADIINASWGGPGRSFSLEQAIIRARAADILFVTAAGNESANNDSTPSYPANYTLDNIISVGSSDPSDQRSGFSNFGASTVDVFAPGSAILSTWYTADNAYRAISGTSMASPLVAGVTALIRAEYPGDGYLETTQRLVAGVDRPAALQGLSISGGRINLRNALRPTSNADPPQINTGLSDRQSSLGGSATFTVSASGSAPLTYTWLLNGNVINGANGASVTLSNLRLEDSGSVQVRVSNDVGVASDSAELTVTGEVSSVSEAIDDTGRTFFVSGSQPWQVQSDSFVVGSNALKSGVIFNSQKSIVQTEVTGPGSVCFWWRVSSEADFDFLDLYINGALVDFISGETGWRQVCYSLPPGSYTIRWEYNKDISLSSGQDAGFLDGFEFISEASNGPEIVSNPISQIISPGGTVTFSVQAEGSGSLAYQWLFNGQPMSDSNRISGARSRELTIQSVDAGDAGNYSVRVTDFSNSVVSTAAQLSVTTALPPTIIEQPQSVSVGVGAEVNLSVRVDGSAPFTYQWFKDGVPLSGETHSALLLTDMQVADSGAYRATVNNASGEATSSSAEVVVTDVSIQPVFLKHPTGKTLIAGDDLSLTVEFGGSEPLTVQWFKDGQAVEGATTSTFIRLRAAESDSGIYTAQVTNEFGTVTSRSAEIDILTPTAALGSAINSEVSGNLIESVGNIPWFAQSRVIDSDSLALQSGAVANLQSSGLSIHAVGPGTVFFRWKVSSEKDRDRLQFRLNGQTLHSISGEIDWETRSATLEAGTHFLEWIYVKDSSGSSGDDAGYIDQIHFEEGARLLQATDFFENAVDLEDSWVYSNPIGFFYTGGFRWVYHPEHTWWYLAGAGGAGGFWAYDLGLGWIYTNATIYPALYAAGPQIWLFYEIGSAAPRLFINLTTGEIYDGGF